MKKSDRSILKKLMTIIKDGKNVFIAISLLILIIQGKYIMELKNNLDKKAQASLINEKHDINFQNINDRPLLENKYDYYKLTDSKIKEETSIELNKFIVDYYYEHDYLISEYERAQMGEKNKCNSKDIEFSQASVDLNNDGVKDYVIMPFKVCNSMMRGASGNGDILIIKNMDNKYIVVGQLTGNGYVISNTKTNGYNDIVTNSHGSWATGTETLYRFQVTSNGDSSYNEYEEAFSKRYDFTRVK